MASDRTLNQHHTDLAELREDAKRVCDDIRTTVSEWHWLKNVVRKTRADGREIKENAEYTRMQAAVLVAQSNRLRRERVAAEGVKAVAHV